MNKKGYIYLQKDIITGLNWPPFSSIWGRIKKNIHNVHFLLFSFGGIP